MADPEKIVTGLAGACVCDGCHVDPVEAQESVDPNVGAGADNAPWELPAAANREPVRKAIGGITGLTFFAMADANAPWWLIAVVLVAGIVAGEVARARVTPVR